MSRRSVLRGAAGVTIALPLLEAMVGRSANAGRARVAPSRFVVVFSPNGTIAERWTPVGNPGAYSFVDPANPEVRILAPLEPHRSDVVVLQGLAAQSRAFGPGNNGHDKGMGHMLSGTELVVGPQGQGEFGHLLDGSAGGPTIDQAIADQIAGPTPYRSLEFGVNAYFDDARGLTSRMCYRGPFEALPPENDPRAAFDRLFLDIDADPAEVAILRAKRRSVLDNVADDFVKLNARVGASDRVKLEAHLDAIRELEESLDSDHGVLAACSVPPEPPEQDYSSNENFPSVGKAQMDLMVMALACDLTRVASLQWSVAQSAVRFSWLGISEDHHGMSHEADDNPSVREQLVEINRWYAEQFAYLVSAMKQVTELDGTLLDHSLVLWTNEQGNGDIHSPDDIPMVLAGSGSGAVQTGRWLQYDGRSQNDLFVSLLQAHGSEATVFGLPEVCTGPLADL